MAFDPIWGLSDTSTNWVNPYFDPSDPRVTNPDEYTRFDYEQIGSGIADSGNLAAAFDKAFLAGNGIINPIDISPVHNQASAPTNFSGLGGIAFNQVLNDVGTTPDQQKSIDFNNAHRLALQNYNLFQNDDYYQDAFSALGIDPSAINSREALDAIDPLTKASVWDIVQRTKQQQNQLPPQGIADSLGGKFALGLAGLINPFAAAGLGAISGGLSGGGGLLGAVTGGLEGYSIGNVLHNGIPGLGIDPFVYGGGTPIPTGDFTHGGRPVLDAPVGIDIAYPSFPTIPRTTDNPSSPSIPLPPVISDTEQNDTPFIPIPSAPTGVPELPEINASPDNGLPLALGGGQDPFNPFNPMAMPGPAQAFKYFGYGDQPF